MNLDQITTKCWILALFERDDGEQLLLGDGWFDFKDSLQHFQPNTFANDVIELQGSDGQMLAGQVRRGAPQSFDGYIGDPITNRQTIEQHRREFLMFFRKRHHYKVVYIFPDGTAIQRKQGYITDAPSVPEIRQKFPEYHVALNFEDVNYYEYAENAQGEEIFSNIRNINISTAATGGLVWDNLGAVSDQMGWKDIATATGQMLAITNPESIKAPIASFEMTGNATQSGTPTPSAPVPIQTVTGRQTITVIGKNLYDTATTIFSNPSKVDVQVDGDTLKMTALENTTSGDLFIRTPIPDGLLENGKTYTISCVLGSGASKKLRLQLRNRDGSNAGFSNGYSITYDDRYVLFVVENPFGAPNTLPVSAGTVCVISNIQVEEGGSETTFESFHEQEQEINLGKNLWDTTVENGFIDNSGTQQSSTNQMRTVGYIELAPNTAYTFSNTNGLVVDRVCYYNGAKTFIERSAYINNKTFTTTSTNFQLARIVIRATDSGNISPSDLAEPQLEKGYTASSYSAYFTPIELCKIGTHQDRIYKENGKWWLHKETGKTVADTSAMTLIGNYSNIEYATTAKPSDFAGYGNYQNIGVLCSHATYQDGGDSAFWNQSNNAGHIYTRADNRVLWVGFAKGTGLDAIKTALANCIIYYPLATPTTTEITDAKVLEGLNSAAGLKLFPGQNNIMDQTPSAQPTMTVQYYTALGPGGGLVWESGEAGGATIIEASGLDSAFPLWTVPGPSTNPTLTNITTGQSITWQGTVPAGQTLEIDMDKQTATLAGANVYAFVSGDWIRIDPGSNRMTYVGTGATQASTLSWNNIVG